MAVSPAGVLHVRAALMLIHHITKCMKKAQSGMPLVFWFCLPNAATCTVKRMQLYYPVCKDLSIISVPMLLLPAPLEVCSSKHSMNDTTYCILITARCLFGGGGYGVMPFIMLDMRLGFYQTHFLLQGVHSACLRFIFKFIGHLYLYIYFLPRGR